MNGNNVSNQGSDKNGQIKKNLKVLRYGPKVRRVNLALIKKIFQRKRRETTYYENKIMKK